MAGKEIRISLNEDDFKKLVSGKEVEKNYDGKTIKLILQDIGFDIMFQSLVKAISGK